MRRPSEPQYPLRMRIRTYEKYQKAAKQYEESMVLYEEMMELYVKSMIPSEKQLEVYANTEKKEQEMRRLFGQKDDPNRLETEEDGVRQGQLRMAKVRHYALSSKRHNSKNN